MGKGKVEVRVIHVFDNAEDAAIEMAGRSDKTITLPGISCAMGEQQVLMNVAFHVYFYLFKYEAGEISKTELDMYLKTRPIPPKVLVNAHPLDFNFVLWSSINKRFYTNREYYLEDLDLENAYSAMMGSYDELSNMYSFDIIIEQMQKMVTDFKANHQDFNKMTMDERITKFRSWNGNEDYINNNFLVNLLHKCRKEQIKRK